MPGEDALSQIARQFGLGATGRYPHGKTDAPDDEGGLKAALCIEGDRITLLFGNAVKWVSMTPDEARALAAALIEKADKIDPK